MFGLFGLSKSDIGSKFILDKFGTIGTLQSLSGGQKYPQYCFYLDSDNRQHYNVSLAGTVDLPAKRYKKVK